ncbi:MAG: pyrroline-5-carboxylate reductase [Alphaproteobacteria bacterium]
MTDSMFSNTSVLLVGCGKMGGALLDGWLDCGLAPERTWVVEPAVALRDAAASRGVAVLPDAGDLPADLAPDMVVLAVKPQSMEAVVAGYRRFVGTGTGAGSVFLSIAAGKPISWFQSRLGEDAAIVRAMPNTPAAVRRGMTVLCANARVSEVQRTRCGGLMEAVGAVAWIDDEALMDAVTAVSGSGPAYVFLLVECLAAAGAAAGLPADLAERLARATVAGSGELLHGATEPAETLRRNVTSPGGTTAAALAELMAADGLPTLMARAVAAATRRSRELAG